MTITCRNIIALLRIYWTSNNSYKDWVRLIFILILVCLNVYLATLFNEWKNAFYTALENYDYEKLLAEIICFCKLAAIAVLASMYSFYLQQIVLLNWRRFLSEYFIDDILCKKRYYMSTIYENVLDNPDQRLTEDIKIFAEKSIEFTVGIINALITLTAFVGILWSLSGALPITIGNYSFTIHGYIVWGAFAYFSLGTYITYVIGKKLKLFNYLYQSSEANFRYALIRLYEYAEQIALLQKENKERGILVLRLNKLLRSFYDIIIKERRLAAFKTGYFQLASIIPVLFCVPLYLKHTIKLGGLMQSASAFSIVIGSLSYFMITYN